MSPLSLNRPFGHGSLETTNNSMISAEAEPWLNDGMIDEIADLNAAFLRLVVELEGMTTDTDSKILGLSRSQANKIADLTTSQFSQLCRCPYTLFSLQLNDHRAWEAMTRGVMPQAYQQRPVWLSPESRDKCDDKVSSFMLTALHYARHLILSGALSAQLVFGIAHGNASTLARIPVSRLQTIARQCHGLLSARFADNSFYWQQLLKNAAIGNKEKLQVTQVSGLHLICGQQDSVAV